MLRFATLLALGSLSLTPMALGDASTAATQYLGEFPTLARCTTAGEFQTSSTIHAADHFFCASNNGGPQSSPTTWSLYLY